MRAIKGSDLLKAFRALTGLEQFCEQLNPNKRSNTSMKDVERDSGLGPSKESNTGLPSAASEGHQERAKPPKEEAVEAWLGRHEDVFLEKITGDLMLQLSTCPCVIGTSFSVHDGNTTVVWGSVPSLALGLAMAWLPCKRYREMCSNGDFRDGYEWISTRIEGSLQDPHRQWPITAHDSEQRWRDVLEGVLRDLYYEQSPEAAAACNRIAEFLGVDSLDKRFDPSPSPPNVVE